MSIGTYAELQSFVVGELDDSLLTSVMPDMITLAESEIKSRVRISEMILRETAPTSTTTRFLALPDNFLEMVSLHLNGDPLTPMSQLSPKQVKSLNVGSGKPKYFSVVGTQLEFERVPDSAYTIEMSLYAFSALSGTNTTNVILTKYPDLYVTETKKFAAKYVMDSEIYSQCLLDLYGDPMKPGLKGIYKRIEDDEKRRNYGNQPLRSRPAVVV